MRNQFRNTGALIVLIAGLALGPGYFIYAHFLSGHVIFKTALPNKANPGPGPVSSLWSSTNSMKLDPAMNPIGLDYACKARPIHRADGRINFQSILMKDNRQVWARKWQIGYTYTGLDEGGDPGWSPIPNPRLSLQVNEPGEYKLITRSIEVRNMALQGLTVQIVRNTHEMRKSLFLSGLILSIAAFFFLHRNHEARKLKSAALLMTSIIVMIVD